MKNEAMNVQFDQVSLLERLKDSDQLAFAKIVHFFTPQLANKAFKFTKNAEDAQDLLQDLFTDLWERRETLNINTSLQSYLYVSLKHRFLRKVMRANLNERALDYLGKRMEQMQASVLEAIEVSEMQNTISQVIKILPEHMQKIFLLRGEDYSIKEIAEALGLAEQTVKTYNMLLKRRIKEAILTQYPDVSHSMMLTVLAGLSLI
ncbi:MAG: RNA polymerase sigma factor [Pedobacter sp.]